MKNGNENNVRKKYALAGFLVCAVILSLAFLLQSGGESSVGAVSRLYVKDTFRTEKLLPDLTTQLEIKLVMNEDLTAEKWRAMSEPERKQLAAGIIAAEAELPKGEDLDYIVIGEDKEGTLLFMCPKGDIPYTYS